MAQVLKKLFLCLLTLLCASLCHSQETRFIGIEDGLSNNTVTSIYKDQSGFMWFGTFDGLNRYDGNSFKVFKNSYNDEGTLPNDIVKCISSDNAGNIWVGTHAGLGIQSNRTLRFSNLRLKYPTGKNEIYRKTITCINRDNKGNMYVGTDSNGLLLAFDGNSVANEIPLLSSSGKITNSYQVAAIAIGNDQTVWVAVDNIGLCQFDKKSERLKVAANALSQITCIIAYNSDKLYVGTVSGVYIYSIHDGTYAKVELGAFNNCSATAFVIDKTNDLWIATDGLGIIKLKISANQPAVVNQITSDVLSSNAVIAIYEDDFSTKWVGTNRGGIDIVDDKTIQFKTYRHEPFQSNSLVNDFVFSFGEDQDKNIWIGTDGGGLSIWNRKQQLFKNYPFTSKNEQGSGGNNITSIIKDDQQNMWFSTFGSGIRRYNLKTQVFEHIPIRGKVEISDVWKLYKDHHGVIWAVCFPGTDESRLFSFAPNKGCFVPVNYNNLNEDILSIVTDGNDNLWLGTYNGIIHVNRISGIDKIINLDCEVRSLLINKAGILWCGTYGRGIFSYNPVSGNLKNYTVANGLCNNKVLNIEEDNKGNLWMSTYHGLSKLNIVNLNFDNYYTADGLQSNQFYFNASAHLSSGELMFGGIKGFNIFNPDSIHRFYNFPKLVITGIRIANTNIDATSTFVKGEPDFYNIDHLTLPYNKAMFSVDFVALQYSQAEKIQYAYMLEGRDKIWNYILDQHSLNYSQLNEGNYILRIKSTNQSGIWNNKEKLIYITVTPPWYRTWWAYCLYLLFIAILLGSYLFYYRRQTNLQYQMKLEKELNENKISFFTNISHELRTPLTLIVNPIKELLSSNGQAIDLVDISTVYRNSRRLLSLVDQLLLFKSSEKEISKLNLTWLNISEICQEVFLCFKNQVAKKNIQYKFEHSGPIYVLGDREKLDIVLFNLLSNAIKYTPEGGEVSLRILELDNSIEIFVADTGIGIPKETGNKLFNKFYRLNQRVSSESGFGIGLYLAGQYMAIHNGALSYTSELGIGSEFKMVLPKSSKPPIDTKVIDEHKSKRSSIVNELILDSVDDDSIVQHSNDKGAKNVISTIETPRQTILLIEDDIDFRTYLKSLMHDHYDIFEVDNAEAGFNAVIDYDPDIVVSDVVLKGMSGIEFCSKMKESPSFSHIPVILLTGSFSPEIKLKGIECGADDYITKPFEKDLLIARINSILKGRNLLKKFFINEITLKQHQLKVPAEYADFVSKCISIIEKHLEDDEFTTAQFTSEIGMSRSKLFRNIKSISGLSIAEFIRYIRLRKAGQLMIESDMQIKEIAFKVGFNDQKHFREQFQKLFEMNPSAFVKKYKNSFANNRTANRVGQIIRK